MIHPDLGGALVAEGVVEGTPAAPAGRFAIRGKGLRWGTEIYVGELRGEGTAARGLDGDMSVTASALDVKSGTRQLDRANIAVTGTLRNHEIQLDAVSPQLDAKARLLGGWFGKDGWVGRVAQLENRGDYPVQLAEAASIEVGADRFVLGAPRACGFGDGRLKVAGRAPRRRHSGNERRVRRHPCCLPAEVLGTAADAVDTTLTLGGRWDLRAGQHLNGILEVAREQGDVVLATRPSRSRSG